MWTTENRQPYNRDKLRYPSDMTDEEWSRVSPLIPPAKRGLSAEQIPVIVARDRHGATTDAVLPKLNRVSIAAALGGIITPANEFCCDGGTAIVAFARKAGIPTHILPLPGKPNPSAPDFHI